MVAWYHTYNYEWWFLFPYMLLVLCSSFLIRLVQGIHSRRGVWLLIIVCTALYFGFYAVQKQWKDVFNEHYVLQQCQQFIYCLYSFMFGILFYRFKILQRCKNTLRSGKNKRFLIYVSMLALCILRMMLGPSIINPFFMLGFIILFNSFSLFPCMRFFLMFMGGHSTNMWLVHTFFAYYFFKDFMYALKYPLLIYVVLLLLSLASSYVIRFCYRLPHWVGMVKINR